MESSFVLCHNLIARSSIITVVLDRGVYLAHGAFWINGLTMERMPSTKALTKFGGTSLSLIDGAYVSLPPMVLGGSISPSQWIRVSTIFDGHEGIALFNSFHASSCRDSDVCRNAVGDTLDRHGWFAVGNNVAARRPADLWAAGIVFDDAPAALF
jgi:hypothetical protein